MEPFGACLPRAGSGRVLWVLRCKMVLKTGELTEEDIKKLFADLGSCAVVGVCVCTGRQMQHCMPRAPPAVKAPIRTQHLGQHSDDGLVGLMPWSWPGGSHGANPPSLVLGQRARLWPKVHSALVEAQHRDAPLACAVGPH